MVKASLPVDPAQVSEQNDFKVSFNTSTGQPGANQTGVSFLFPVENFNILAVFAGFLYWVPANSSFTDHSPSANGTQLTNFAPTTDSLVLKTIVCTDAAPSICAPLPGYVTYENVDKASVQTAIEQIIQDFQNNHPTFTAANAQSVVNDFFNGITPIICSAGDVLGSAAEAAPGTGNVNAGFWLRTWSVNGVELVYPHVYLHHLSQYESSISAKNVVTSTLQYGISGSVGFGGKNDADDIFLVRSRLRDLGFIFNVMPLKTVWDAAGVTFTRNPRTGNMDYSSGLPPNCTPVQNSQGQTYYNVNQIMNSNGLVTTNEDANLEDVIRLFQSIALGPRWADRTDPTKKKNYHVLLRDTTVIADNGVINKASPTEIWLWASNTPQWIQFEKTSQYGFADTDEILPVTLNGIALSGNLPPTAFDYGTKYLTNAIKEAGANFMQHWWPQLKSQLQNNNDVIRTNDASYAGGGWTPEHATHQIGLDVDIRLPTDDGLIRPVNIVNNKAHYDKNAQNTAQAICQAFSDLDEVPMIFFNDEVVQANVTKVQTVTGHNDHIHVNVDPPNDPIPNYTPS